MDGTDGTLEFPTHVDDWDLLADFRFPKTQLPDEPDEPIDGGGSDGGLELDKTDNVMAFQKLPGGGSPVRHLAPTPGSSNAASGRPPVTTGASLAAFQGEMVMEEGGPENGSESLYRAAATSRSAASAEYPGDSIVGIPLHKAADLIATDDRDSSPSTSATDPTTDNPTDEMTFEELPGSGSPTRLLAPSSGPSAAATGRPLRGLGGRERGAAPPPDFAASEGIFEERFDGAKALPPGAEGEGHCRPRATESWLDPTLHALWVQATAPKVTDLLPPPTTGGGGR